MKAFNFENNNLEVIFGDIKYFADPAIAEAAMREAQNELEAFNTMLAEGKAGTADIETVMGKIAEKIDETFGEGSLKNICKARKRVSLHDLLDIVMYTKAAAIEFEKRKRQTYSGYMGYGKNREERRRNKK